MKGVSIIICCYNSAWIITDCLNALCSQKIPSHIPTEIIIVDNCCKDNTAEIAENIMKHSCFTFKIVPENNPGLMNARLKGIQEAKYEYLLFVDDDNLLADDYVLKVYSIMNSDEKIGALGGFGIPLFWKTEKPYWFDEFSGEYALGTQLDDKGKVRNNYLYGAGCCYRKSALLNLFNKKIQSNLLGRCGTALTSGEDSELCKQLILSGYSLMASNDLIFKHVLTSKRLTIEYLDKLYYSFGVAGSTLKVYDYIIRSYKHFNFRFTLKYYINYIYYIIFSIINNKSLKHRFLNSYIKGYLDSINNKKLSYFFNLHNSLKDNFNK